MSPRSLATRISGVLCALTLLLVCSFALQRSLLADNHIIYVNDNASGSNNGSSWANAYTKLQDAIVAATPGKEIWVAAGVYYPDEGGNAVSNNMYMSFELMSGVALYGGFAGTENALSQRNVATNLTVLSSDIDHEVNEDVTDANHIVTDVANINGQNGLHAVLASGVDSTARLDGFVLTAGLANRSTTFCPEACGGALFAVGGSPTLANLTVIGNTAVYGAGMLFRVASSPTLSDSLFTKNYSPKFAGGLQVQEEAVITATRVKFLDNFAQEVGGGANISNVDATLNDVDFVGNKSGDKGGGIYTSGGKVTINQALFERNSARKDGGGIYADGGSLEIQNALFEDNSALEDSGAGIYSKNTTIDIKQSDFVGNSGFYNGGGIASFENDLETTITLTDVTMTLNQTRNADGAGGALLQQGGRLKAVRVSILRNSSFFYGGGMYLYNVNATLTNVQFLGNYTVRPTDNLQSYGGGMAVFGGDLTASNLVFSGNYGSAVGALYLRDANAQFYNATFAYNSTTDIDIPEPRTGGIRVVDSTLLLTNSILWDDSMISTNGGGSPTRYVLFNDIEAPADNEGIIRTQTSPFRANPTPGDDGFGNNPSTEEDESANDFYGDLRLKSTAPAIDAGSNGDVPADILDIDKDSDLGEELPLDAGGALRQARFVAAEPRVDMGAYEYQNAAPTAVMAGPFMLNEGASVALDATGSTDDGSIVGYAWDCTNNGSADVSEDSPTEGACAYPDNGNYTLRLTVNDNLGATGTATTTVTVANVAPTYTPAADQNAVAGNSKKIELGSFTDPGAEGTWDITVNWGGETTTFTTAAAGALPATSHTFAAPGTFNVVLTVSDGESDDTSSFKVEVSAAPPGTPVVTAPAAQQAAPETEQMFNLGSFTDAGSSGPWQVTVSWGDDSADTVFEMTSGGPLPAQPHTYMEPGDYDVLVTVSDGTLNATVTFRVTIGAQEDGARILLPLTSK